MSSGQFITLLVRFVPLCASVVVLSGAQVGCKRQPAQGETQSVPASTNNAAEEYRSLHAAMGGQLITQLAMSGGDLTFELVQSLPSVQLVRDRLVWATTSEHCDWGIDYSTGHNTNLPHLAKVRDLVRLLRADAQWKLQSGNTGAAAEDVAAIVRMSRHVQGRFQLEAIVAIASLIVAADLVFDNAESWSPQIRRMLLDELQQIDQQDPYAGNSMLAWDKQLAASQGLPAPDEQMFYEAQRRAKSSLASAIEALK